MKKGRKWMLRCMPVVLIALLSISEPALAQDDYGGNNDNNYQNEEALIQPEQDVNFNTFRDELSPYGSWMNYPGYGNVWVCNVAGFRPYYTGGHWAYTHYGWTWVSDYNWGWAPFHYGRWAYDAMYGWLWVPGYTWGPAWVSWRTGGSYYGWAPLSPGIGVGVNINIGIPANNWVFLPHRYMGYNNMNRYYANRQQNVTIIRNTTVINNTNVYNNNRYYTGPSRSVVEQQTGRRIQQQNLYVSNKPSADRQDRKGIYMYRPAAAANNNGSPITRGSRINQSRENNSNGGIVNNTQDNVRQRPLRQPNMQNGNVPQQQSSLRPTEDRESTTGNRQNTGREGGINNDRNSNYNGNNNAPDNNGNRLQREQRSYDPQVNDARNRQQIDAVRRQQQMNDRRMQMQQQQLDAQRQQMNELRQQQLMDRRMQMQQQNEMRRQQADQLRQLNNSRQQPGFTNRAQSQPVQRQQVFPQRTERSSGSTGGTQPMRGIRRN